MKFNKTLKHKVKESLKMFYKTQFLPLCTTVAFARKLFISHSLIYS